MTKAQQKPELGRQPEQGPVQPMAPQVAFHRAQVNGNGPRPADLLALQRTVGNRQVRRMVARRGDNANDQQQRTFAGANPGIKVQTKLAVGAPDAIYEQNADHMAEQVMRMPESGSDTTIQRMLACPPRLADTDPTPTGWQSYHGDSSVFHCGFRGILEDRNPTRSDPQNECFYDHSGTLVDENHAYAGCRGTPNQYDSARHPILHAGIDSGGIVRAGAPAFITARVYDLNRAIGAAIQVVTTAGRVIRSVVDGLKTAIALGVLTASASVDPGNWSFQGLSARSVRHLNLMGAILGSAALSQNVDTLLKNLTRRLDSFPIAGLLDEMAQDINQILQSRGGTTQKVTSADLGALSLLQLVDWLRAQGIVQYVRPPEDIAREQLAAQPAATP